MFRCTLIFSLITGCVAAIDPAQSGDDGAGPGPGGGSSGGSNGDGQTPSGDDPARLFAATSPWNVPASGSADPGSDTMIVSGRRGSLIDSLAGAGRTLDIAGTDDYPDYGIPVFEADASTPRVAVADTYGWWGGGFAAVPVPVAAMPARGTDHHLCIVDRASHTLWEFWEMTKAPGGGWTAGAGVTFDLTGPGYQSEPNRLGARAYGGSAAAGLIRYDEMRAGQIKHALAMAYAWTRGTAYARGVGVDGKTQNIASHNDNVADADRNTAANIPEGARLRLRPSVDLAARCGTNAACRTIGTALATYGAYMVDTAGVTTLVAEVLTDRHLSWTGVLRASDAAVFTAADFEVLAMPAALTQAPQE
jgi:hypothetical protein